MRFWIITWIAALVLLMAGCGLGAANAPAGSADRTSTTGTPEGTTAEETTTDLPPEENAYDPPAQAPQKQAGLFFPQKPRPGGLSLSALGGGKLVVKNSCIYMGTRHHSDVVVWPYGYSLSRKDGEIRILNEKGKVVAQVGEEVRIGGGEITQAEAGPTPEAARRQFEEKRGELGVPNRCRGPLWVSSGVVRW